MNAYTDFICFLSLLISVGIFMWLLIQCKSLFTGFITTCLAILSCYTIYKYSLYIAEAIIWGVRFATVIMILLFILGVFPKSKKADAG